MSPILIAKSLEARVPSAVWALDESLMHLQGPNPNPGSECGSNTRGMPITDNTSILFGEGIHSKPDGDSHNICPT